MTATILHGDCRELIAAMPDNSVDAIVTDPPYELGFMGKRWDASGIAYSIDLWAECLRVLKPGGHLIAFGGTRTYHRMACAIEDAGFEIRDSIHWLYGSGFPKSLDVSKAIDKAAGVERTEIIGWTNKGMPPGSHKAVGHGEGSEPTPITAPATDAARQWEGWGTALKPAHEPAVLARKPLTGTVAANVLEHGIGALNIDGTRIGERWPANVVLDDHLAELHPEWAGYFYCSKASKAERNAGLDALPAKFAPTMGNGIGDKHHDPQTATPKRNTHPTVKPLDLMRYLIRLVTPPGGTVLDPFAGSGTTLAAAILEGFNSIGCELTADYLPIIEGRIAWAQQEHERTDPQPTLFGDTE